MTADSLCYIMDYSGHYYRTNQANQLVAVSGERDAELFTFTQANSRINVGRKSSFYRVVPMEEGADSQTMEDEEMLENDMVIAKADTTMAVKNVAAENNATTLEESATTESEVAVSGDAATTVSEAIVLEDTTMAVSEATVPEEYPTVESAADISVGCLSTVKELAYDELIEQTPKSASSYDLSEMDWAEYLTHFTYLVSGLGGYRGELSQRLSDVEQKICDILHYIELCETDDDEAADLIELLRVCRENRRDIKDELQRIEYFQSDLGTNANAIKAKHALKSIKGLETRRYRPRKYDELFENCTMKDRRLKREDLIIRAERRENKKTIFGSTNGHDKGGEETMAEDRIYTSFDGRENDWLAFARSQADFYRNVYQYMTNLRLEISEIDEEIESVLTETEEANCNVAQGYKVFKRLKELRLARKDKSRELDCLRALTDYIDCSAFADTCEANLEEVESIMQVSEGAGETDCKRSDAGQRMVQPLEEVENMVS